MLSSLGLASVTALNSNRMTITVTLNPPAPTVRLLAVPEFAIYKNSVASENLYPSGSNWASSEILNFDVESWNDLALSDTYNLKHIIQIENTTGSDIPIWFTFAGE